MNESFADVQESLNWAKSALTEANDILLDFFTNKDNFARVLDLDEKTRETVVKMKMLNRLPSSFTRKTTEVVTLTRHSFDRSLNAAIRTVSNCEGVTYPWAQNPKPDLVNKLLHPKTQVEKIPRVLWDLIHVQEPYGTGQGYSGGNDLIRQMATYANRKHSIGYVVKGHVFAAQLPSFKGRGGGPGAFVKIGGVPVWDSVKNEAEIIRFKGVEASIGNDYRFSFEIRFDAGPPLGELNALECLDLFISKAQSVLTDFERFCSRL